VKRALDQDARAPLSSERLTEIRERRIPLGPNAVWVLKADRDALLAEVDRLASERDRAVAAAEHMAGAMAKVGPAIEQAIRLAASGDAASAAAVLGDVAPEAPEGGEVRG
jgi:hypothetical protein